MTKKVFIEMDAASEMPKKQGWYFVTCEGVFQPGRLFFNGKGFYTGEHHGCGKVIKWMQDASDAIKEDTATESITTTGSATKRLVLNILTAVEKQELDEALKEGKPGACECYSRYTINTWYRRDFLLFNTLPPVSQKKLEFIFDSVDSTL